MNLEILEPETRFQCRHIFTDGRRCGSPAIRGPEGAESFCYYHHNSRRPIQHAPTRRRRQSRFTLPNPEDRSGIQASIGEVLRRIASNEIDPRRAGLLLYGLQIASLNLPKSTPSEQAAEPVSEVTHDPQHGLLAPPAELGHDRPKSSVELLLEQFDNTPTIDLQGSADPAPQPSTAVRTIKSTPKPTHLKTLRNNRRGRGTLPANAERETPSRARRSRQPQDARRVPRPVAGDRLLRPQQRP
jgi:hypothetical protein